MLALILKAFRSLGLSAFIITLCIACSDDSVQHQPLSNQATILAIGDSLTAGKGALLSQSYPAVLSSRIRLPVINAGISGELSADGLSRLSTLLEQHQPELVIICHGGNDILRKLDLNQTKNNLRNMIQLAQAHRAQVLLLGVPKPNLILKPLKLYQQLADETGSLYLPDVIADVLSSRGYKSDTFHPNAAGYTEMATQIAEFMQQKKLISN